MPYALQANLKNNQQGAMFGLDARVAVGILAAISAIAGIYMLHVIAGSRVDQLLLEHSAYATGVEALQEDLETNIHTRLNISSDANALLALVDETQLLTNAQNAWHGPYVKELYTNQHKLYGAMTLTQKQASISNTCSTAQIRNRECFYYWAVASVPLTIINELNTRLDQTEVTPQTMGTIQWNNTAGTTATLHFNLGLVAP